MAQILTLPHSPAQVDISVIIPTYKPQDYLWECLDSLAAQTLEPERFEVTVVLNGCNEPYKSLIQEHISSGMQHLNVRLVQTDTPGVSNARNMGIDMANGTYLTFIDDDDYVSPRYLEGLLEKAAPGIVAVSDALSFTDGENTFDTDYYLHKVYVRRHKCTRQSLFKVRSTLNSPWMKLFHRDIIGTRRFNTRFSNGEDNLMMLTISDAIRTVRFADTDCVYYRRFRPNSAVTRPQKYSAYAHNILKLMWEYTVLLASRPFSYNYPFFLSRYAAELKSLLEK